MKNKYILDSSVWIEYFKGTERGMKLKQIIEEETIGTSIIAIVELSDKFERENESFEKSLEFIKSKAKILNIAIETAVEAGKLKKKIRIKNPKFGLADAIHLATAHHESAILITCDKDFTGVEKTIVI